MTHVDHILLCPDKVYLSFLTVGVIFSHSSLLDTDKADHINRITFENLCTCPSQLTYDLSLFPAKQLFCVLLLLTVLSA